VGVLGRVSLEAKSRVLGELSVKNKSEVLGVNVETKSRVLRVHVEAKGVGTLTIYEVWESVVSEV